MKKKIAIIGAGQLGGRHLQGVARSSINIDIEIVEPFKHSIEVVKQRYEEVKDKKHVSSINFYDSIDFLSDRLDLVIVATSSDVRFMVVQELLEKKNVENLILEKVLFQNIDEYVKAEEIFSKTNTNCWVNHARRMFPVYKKLKDILKDSTQIHYSFQGGNWGLGCNALHFVDHLAFFVDSTNVVFDSSNLDKKIYNSKRKGFIEFNGLLSGKIDNHSFSLYSNKIDMPSLFSIVSDNAIVKIDEELSTLEIRQKENNWQKEIWEEKIIYFQSELSNKLIEDIFVNKEVWLPTYKEAMGLHIPFIKELLKHMNEIDGQEHKICPIT